MWRVWRGGLAGRWRENSPPKPPPEPPQEPSPDRQPTPGTKSFQKKKKKRQDFHKMQFSRAKLMKTTVFWSFSSVSLGKTEVCENAVVFFWKLFVPGVGCLSCPVLSCPVLSVKEQQSKPDLLIFSVFSKHYPLMKTAFSGTFLQNSRKS